MNGLGFAAERLQAIARENVILRKALRRDFQFQDIVSRSASIANAFSSAEAPSATRSRVTGSRRAEPVPHTGRMERLAPRQQFDRQQHQADRHVRQPILQRCQPDELRTDRRPLAPVVVRIGNSAMEISGGQPSLSARHFARLLD